MALFMTRKWVPATMLWLLAAAGTVPAQTPGFSAFPTISQPIGTIIGAEFNPAAAQNADLFAITQATVTVPLAETVPDGKKTHAPLTLSADCVSTLTVNDLGDGSDVTPGNGVCATSGGTCTLRAAIQEANALGACAPLTINFSVNGTITLGSNLPNITKSMTINGNGRANTIISGNNLYRSLNSIQTDGLSVTIQNLKATNGRDGNYGGALYINSEGGTVTVNNVEITNSNAGYGGGIMTSNATVVVSNSIIRDNTSTIVSAGIHSGGEGSLTLVNTLITGNSGPHGGVFNNGAVLKVYNCTVVGNISSTTSYTPGIHNNASGPMTLYNSIIADNIGARGDCHSVANHDVKNTLIKDGSCGITNGVNGNLTGDPGLNPDYTLTANSIAVGAGNNSLLPAGVTVDLAGNARIQQGKVDMGAYESPFAGNTPPTITAAAALTRQRGSTGIPATIATVSDLETAAGSLTVTATTVPAGITVSDIVNSSGTVSATITAGCNAAIGGNAIVLTVTDANSRTSTANLTVNVTANTPPTLTYNTVSVNAGGSTDASPSTASDNGSIVSYSVQSQGSYTGTVTVNSSGVVSFVNAGPVGIHTVLIRATDNCTVFTDAELTVTVVCPPITLSGVTLTQPTCAVTTGTAVVNATGSSMLEYSKNGTDWVSSSTFSGLAPGNYTFSVRLVSNPTCVATSAQQTVNALPVAPTLSGVTLTQPTCAVTTGTAVVNASGSSTLEYSKNGTDWVSSSTFSGLAPGNYTFSVRLVSNPTCVATSTQQTINIVPTAPTLSGVTLTQPTCAITTGTAVVNATGSSTLEYSGDGTDWVSSSTFSGLAPGNYTFSVRLVSNPTCVATSAQQTVNALPVAPTLSGVTLTQPTCAVTTGTAVVNATGSGTLEYSKDGTNWVSSSTFSGLAPGNYTFSVRLVSNPTCVATSTQQTINIVPTAPTLSGVTLTQPTCAVTTGTAVVNATGSGTLEYSKDGTNWVSSSTFSGLAPGNYTFSVRLVANPTCVATSAQQTVNALPVAPTLSGVTLTQPTCAVTTGTAVVNASGSSTLEYSKNDTDWVSSSTFSGLAPGNYTFSVRLVANPTCVATSAQQTINPVPVPNATINYTGSPFLNVGTASVTLTGNSGGTYSSTNGLSINAATGDINLALSTPGTYTVTYTIAANGSCTQFQTTTSVEIVASVRIIYVNVSNTAPDQDGSTWAKAFSSLQAGMSAAASQVGKTQVWVAQGAYIPGTLRRDVFAIPSGVEVYGGFVGTEALLSERNWKTRKTILSGEIGTNALSDNVNHVVVFSATNADTRLDGFTVEKGYADFVSSNQNTELTEPAILSSGGGILAINKSRGMITNCIITQNRAIAGGGILLQDSSKVSITKSILWGNEATFGGGIYVLGGSTPRLENLLIVTNKALGGGLYINRSQPLVLHSTIAANQGTGGTAGGIFNVNSTVAVKNSILWGNTLPQTTAGSVITYSIVEGGDAGMGNKSLNPLFVNAGSSGLAPMGGLGDYHLQNCSSAVNAGDNAGTPSDDLDGALRPYPIGPTVVDMGAYESQSLPASGPASLTVTDPITSGTVFKSAGTITATNQISTATVTYQGGQSVNLLPGFSATGNTFQAVIGACPN